MLRKSLCLNLYFVIVLFILPITELVSQPAPGNLPRCSTNEPTPAEMLAVRQALAEWQAENLASFTPTSITIPVAFHVIRHDDGTTADVTDMQIYDQLDVLNSSYLATHFQFSLHSIERVNNTA